MRTISICEGPDVSVLVGERRRALGLTQRQLAQRAGCSLSTVANIEAGCVPRRSQVLPAILTTLDRAAPEA